MQSPRPAGGDEEPPNLAEHECLPLLLQHASLAESPRALVSFGSTCKGVAACLADSCRCSLHLELSTRELDEALAWSHWLARWAGLARSLEIELNRVSLPAVEAAFADALTAAAAGPPPTGHPQLGWAGPLRARAVKANAAGPLLLAQLPPGTLTQLDLGHVVDYAEPGAAAAALQRLTALESLTVLSARSVALLPATSALTRLTHACLLMRDLHVTAPLLQHLPPQLRKLELTVAWGHIVAARPPLPLRHVTGLQELRCSGYLRMQANDELPGSLVSLQVPDCHIVAPLLPLSNLKSLNLYNCTTPAAELKALGCALPQLDEVALGYFGSEESPAVEPGWPGLPLRSLDFDSNCGEFQLQHECLTVLGRLGSCLTQLALTGGIVVEAGCAGLASVLAKLTKLHTLRLAAVELDDEPEPEQHSATAAGDAVRRAAALDAAPAGPDTTAAAAAAHTGARHVMVAVAGLPSLRSVKLGSLGWLAHPAADLAPLAAATQLTCLHLMDLGVTRRVVDGVLCALTQLRELDLSDNPGVGDDTLTRIGRALPLLRNLDVSGTDVSPEGVRALKEALPLVDVVSFQSSGDEEEWL